MTVYQCLYCRNYYGKHEDAPELTPFPSITQRHSDCSIWNCPHCKRQQDSRDIQPFLGVRGGHGVRQLTDNDVAVELLEVPWNAWDGWRLYR